MKIHKVVIPAAGLGTRLFPATKEQSKEMLPIFSNTITGELSVKPVVQAIFENLYDAEIREFCYIVGRGKRGIEDHFTPDYTRIKSLEGMGKNRIFTDLEAFYSKLNNAKIMWVNQPEPKGFGNAVKMAQPFIQKEACLVHAGDSFIMSKQMDYIKKLINTFEDFNADAAFLVLEIDNPRHYGIVEGREVKTGIYKVNKVTEKPEKPATNLAIMAMYSFKPIIFKALDSIKSGLGGEIQLTDAIQTLIDWDLRVYAVKLNSNYSHIDIGSPERYWEALCQSHRFYSGKNENILE